MNTESITDVDEIKQWIVRHEGGKILGVCLASREALRMLPLLAAEFRYSNRKHYKIANGLVLTAFRSLITSWATARFSEKVDQFKPANDSVLGKIAGSPTDGRAARAFCNAAQTANGAGTASLQVAAAKAARVAFAGDAVAFSRDMLEIQNGSTATELALMPLWIDSPSSSPMLKDWEDLRDILLRLSSDWKVWTDWYDAVLSGHTPWGLPTEIELEFISAVVKIPIKTWNSGAEIINPELVRRLGNAGAEIGNVSSHEDPGSWIYQPQPVRERGPADLALSSAGAAYNHIIPIETSTMYESIFLSHTSADKKFVRKLRDDLIDRGVSRVWVDEAEIEIGDSLIQKIEEGMKLCNYIGVVLSPRSVVAPWVRKELDIAINREISRGKVLVLPLIYEACEIPAFLEGKLYADFTDPANYQITLSRLLKRLLIK
ncbi:MULTISPECIES: toll/interleukin-1 receptor domain-containing protein [Agrobacterium]|uniref:toll/interleukin-1 receptor domain-containing protein n=1 Tax=Agrobacterium TaxID=357 RepID=UPI00201B72BB|nr:toll/interleukin-1 receptor domain-containing protein [Agrobacterium rubi]MCL6654819.1 hypothetical protein [Agrobacterium rubi]